MTTFEDSRSVAKAFGYTPEQLEAITTESNMILGCGNPVAAASIKEVRCHGQLAITI
jgi:arsenite methyltransferase